MSLDIDGTLVEFGIQLPAPAVRPASRPPDPAPVAATAAAPAAPAPPAVPHVRLVMRSGAAAPA
eukprot:1479926-Prymnesium_polylepis.1